MPDEPVVPEARTPVTTSRTPAEVERILAEGAARRRASEAARRAAGLAPVGEALIARALEPRTRALRDEAPALPPELPATREATCGCGARFAQRLDWSPTFPFYTPARCTVCTATADATAAQTAEATARADRAERRRKVLADLDVPTEFASATLTGFTLHGDDRGERAAQAALARAARDFARAVEGWLASDGETWPADVPLALVLSGPTGTGKSHLLWALARRTAARLVDGRGPVSRRAPGVVLAWKWARVKRYVTGTWGAAHGAGDGDRTSEAARILRLQTADLLAIDELSWHAEHGVRAPHAHLLEIVGERIERGRPTVLTTNEEERALAELLGGPLFGRIAARDGIVAAGRRDYRVHEQLPAARARRAAARAAARGDRA